MAILEKPAKGTATRERRKKHRALRAKETAAMQQARRRDKVCRFPLCPCGKLKIRLEVAHQVHRGMGGNPAGDRTTTSLLVLLCLDRHQGMTSLHSGDIRWLPLTSEGADGPIVWEFNRGDGHWVELARESARGVPNVVRAPIILNALKDQMMETYR